jgi:hypothetical protein
MLTEEGLLESIDLTPLIFFLWIWMKTEVYKINVDTRDELPAGIMDAAAHIMKRGDQLRRTKCDLCTRVAKSTEVHGGIFEY